MINFLKSALWLSMFFTMLSMLLLFICGGIWILDETDTTMKALTEFFVGATFVSMAGIFFSVLGFILMADELE